MVNIPTKNIYKRKRFIAGAFTELLFANVYISALVSGLLFALVFLFSGYLWPLSFVALVPISYGIHHTKHTNKWKWVASVFFAGSLMGFVYTLSILIWFWDTLPLSWLGIYDYEHGIILVAIAWVYSSAALSLPTGLWAFAFSMLKRFNPIVLSTLSAIVFVLAEIVGMLSFSFFTYGVGGSVAPHFSFAMIGYALSNNELLLQIARIGGVFSLSFVIVLTNMCIYLFLAKKQKKVNTKFFAQVLCVVALIFGIALAGFMLHKQSMSGAEANGATAKIALIHTNFEPKLVIKEDEFGRRMNILKDLFAKASMSGASLVVFPEGSNFIKNELNKNGEIRSNSDISLIDSARVKSDGDKESLLSVLYSTRVGAIRALSVKDFLLPFGEYMPYVGEIVISQIVGDKAVATLKKYRSIYPSAKTSENISTGTPISLAFCSEIANPVSFFNRRQEKKILVVLSSLSWFHNSLLLNKQIQSIARVRAVESNMPVIVSANGSSAFVVNSSGRVGKISDVGNGVLITKIKMK